MATSGSVDFNLDRNQIVTAALKKINAIEMGETPEAEMLEDGAESLNLMFKEWQGDGLHLWTKKEGVLFLTAGQARYTLGPGSTDHATEETTLVKTDLSVAGAALATSITLTDAAGIATAYRIGVVLDSGVFHWTTVNGAPVGNVVTLTAALPTAAALAKKVYAYQSALVRPLRAMTFRRRDEIAEQDIPIIGFSRQEYFDTPNKPVQSLTTEVYYDPQLDDGEMYLWPTPTDIDSTMRFTFSKPIEDFDNATDEPDIPQEWLNAVVYNLALLLSDDYDVPIEKYNRIERRALRLKAKVMMWDTEPESIYFVPDLTVGGWG